MIKIIKEIKIEVSKPNVFQAIVAKQYDMNTRFLKATLVDCGTTITVTPSDTKSVIINAERPDGQSKGFDGVINDDGTVTVPLHSWMLELEGTVICDISVIDTAIEENQKLTTTSFTLIVEKAAYGGDDITSDPQYDILVELINKVESSHKFYYGTEINYDGELGTGSNYNCYKADQLNSANKGDCFVNTDTGAIYYITDVSIPENGYATVFYKIVVKPSSVGDIETALDSIIALQNSLIGGDE